MSYAIQSSYFTDYWWKDEGTQFIRGGAAPTNPLDPYCDWQYWFDRLTNGAPWPWYTGKLLATTKFYGTTDHEYTTPTKMGLFTYSGPADDENMNYIDIVESAYEEPYPPAGPTRPGFEGQYGAAPAVGYTGTTYELSVGHINDATIAPPPATHSHGPFGITLYADSGVAGTTDGIQLIFVPTDSWLTIQDSTGVFQTLAGPRIVVAAGKLRDAGAGNQPSLTLVTSFTTYADGTAIAIAQGVEYFVRAIYYPEQAPLKNLYGSVDCESNYDRRLFIWFGSDKKRKKAVGVAELTEYTYTVAKKYVQLFAYNRWYDSGQQQWEYYTDGFIQFDEIEVGSEYLPFSGMDCWLKHSDQSYAQLYYQKEDNELTHDATSTTMSVPTVLIKDQIKILSISNNHYPTRLYYYGSDFIPAFADGWTVTSTTGTRTNFVTPFTEFRDNFRNTYTNKGRDPNYTVVSGTWDTSTTPGYLTGVTTVPATVQKLQLKNNVKTDGDFCLDTTLSVTPTQVNSYVQIKMGLTAAYGNQVGAVLVVWNNSNGWKLGHYHAGAWAYSSTSNTYSPSGTERYVKVIRIGCYLKLYVDGVLLCTLKTKDLSAATGYVEIDVYDITVVSHYFNIGAVFPNSYAYMYNTAGSTAVSGNIYRSVAMTHITGHCEVTFWEDFSSGSANAEARVKLHWDNGTAGTNWLGIRLDYVGATGVKTLYLHDTSASSVAINLPTNQSQPISGYTQHSYRIWWATDGLGNITQLAVYNASDGELLGVATCSHAYPGNMRLELLTLTANNTEQAYFGSVFLFEDPLPRSDVVEVPIFHGQVRRVSPMDDKGVIVVTAFGMTYPALLKSSFNTSTGKHDTEQFTTDSTLLLNYLPTGVYDPYWKWWHPWNADITNFPGTWIGHRQRGRNMFDVMNNLAEYSCMHFQATPEQQFIFREYYRDFTASDILELGNGFPEGLFLTSDITYVNKNETNYIIKCQRIDDATLNARIGNMTMHPVDFQQPFVPNDLVRNGGAYVPPTMSAYAPVNTVGNLGTDEGNAGIDHVGSTLGSMGPPAIGTSNPGPMQGTWNASILRDKSHKNQVYSVSLFSSKPWLRPMDRIMLRIDTLNPDINTVAPSIVDKYMYIIQSVHHKTEKVDKMTQDTVEYVIGRVETDKQNGLMVTGLGAVSSDAEGDRTKFSMVKDARSMTLQ